MPFTTSFGELANPHRNYKGQLEKLNKFLEGPISKLETARRVVADISGVMSVFLF